MSARGLAALALLAGVALAALWLTQPPRRDPDRAGEAGGRLLPGLEERLDAVTGVRVERGGGDLVARVQRGEAGWRVANRWGYPADTATVRETLIGLARARRVAAKTERPAAYAELGVAPIDEAAPSTLAVTLEGLDEPLTVLIGEAAPGGARGTYARRADARRVWRVAPSLARPGEIGDWLDARLIDVPAERIERVRIAPAAGRPVRVTRPDGPEGSFRLERPSGREPLSDSIARSLARVVTGLRLVDVRPAAAVRDWPRRATAYFDTFNGLRVVLTAFSAGDEAQAGAVRLRARALSEAGAGVARQVRRLNARWSGWAYTLPDYKWTNATHTLASVLE